MSFETTLRIADSAPLSSAGPMPEPHVLLAPPGLDTEPAKDVEAVASSLAGESGAMAETSNS